VLNHKINSGKGNIADTHYNRSDLDANSRKIITELQKIINTNNLDLHQIYVKFDKSKDNELDINEFTKMVMVIDNNLNPDQIKDIFGKFDVNKDGSITFEEFHKLILETDYTETKENDILLKYRADRLIKKLRDIIVENHINVDKIFKKFDATKDNAL
jgi:hypothetical protein